jgi:4'-phosphopantetheinyl transferase
MRLAARPAGLLASLAEEVVSGLRRPDRAGRRPFPYPERPACQRAVPAVESHYKIQNGVLFSENAEERENLMRRPVPVWLTPPAEIVLSDEAVHVWSAPLDLTPAYMSALRDALTTGEICKAESFCFERDRVHFIAARGLLRVILGRYLNRKPAHLCFEFGPYWKPFLSTSPGMVPISFNVSHSQGLALLAVTLGREIGIGVEYLRTDFSWQEVAERFFSPHENADLRALPEREQLEAFFSCWTRKEAYIKARGEGLSHVLDQFDVSVDPKEPARLLTTRGDPREASHWSLQALTPATGYVGPEPYRLAVYCLRYGSGRFHRLVPRVFVSLRSVGPTNPADAAR